MFNKNLQSDINNLILSRKNELDTYLQALIDDYGIIYSKWYHNAFIYTINDKFNVDEQFVKMFTVASRKLKDIGIELSIGLSPEYPDTELSTLVNADKFNEVFLKYKKRKYSLEGIRRARLYLRDI